jgi:hypothetical protein
MEGLIAATRVRDARTARVSETRRGAATRGAAAAAAKADIASGLEVGEGDALASSGSFACGDERRRRAWRALTSTSTNRFGWHAT